MSMTVASFKLATSLVLSTEKVIQIASGLSCDRGICVTIPTPLLSESSPGLQKASIAEITLLRKRKKIPSGQSKSKSNKKQKENKIKNPT